MLDSCSVEVAWLSVNHPMILTDTNEAVGALSHMHKNLKFATLLL